MLDVLHYFLEEDINYQSEYHENITTKTRKRLYMQMYGVTYKYGVDDKPKQRRDMTPEEFLDSFEDEESDEVVPEPFNPRKMAVKSYIPATQITEDSTNPFGNILDAPMK